MKFLIIILLALLPATNAIAQRIESIEKQPAIADGVDFDLHRVIINPVIPEMPVEDITGQMTTLAKFIRKNRKYPGKPVLLVTSYNFCGGCRDGIKRLYKDGLAAKYNFVVIYEEIAGSTIKTGLREFMEKFTFNTGYPDLLFVKTDQKNSEKYLLTRSTPLYLIADNNLRPVYSFLGYENGQIAGILKLVDNKLISRERISYNKAGTIVANKDKETNFTFEVLEDAGHMQLNQLLQNRLINSSSYLVTEKALLKDGMSVENDLSYDNDSNVVMKQLMQVEYTAGRPKASFTSYHSNGKTNIVYPLNGTFQSFDSKGNLEKTGPVKNGLGEGLHKSYKDNLLNMELTYAGGLFNGPYKIYEAGKLKTKGIYRNDVEYGLKQQYDKEGLLYYETWCSAKYELAGGYADGLAYVKLNGKFGYIDKKGVEVIPIQFDEADIFKDGKAKVKKDGEYFYINTSGKR